MKSPADGTTNFPLTEPRVWAMFDRDMHAESVRNSIFLYTGCQESVAHPPTSPSYDPITRTVTFEATKLEPNEQYSVQVTRNARDELGTPLEAAVFWRFSTGPYLDRSAPTFDGLQSVDINSSTELTLKWSAAVDLELDNQGQLVEVTPQDRLEYLVYRGVGNFCATEQINLVTPFKSFKGQEVCIGSDQDPTTLECSYQVTELTADTPYCFIIRARDRGCHLEGNRKTVHALTSVGGRLYVANLGANNLLVFDNAGQAEDFRPRVITSNQTQLNSPLGVALGSKSTTQGTTRSLFVSNFAGDAVLAYDWQEGSALPTGDHAPRVLPSALVSRPIGMFMDTANDKLYVSSYSTGRIIEYQGASGVSASGIPTTPTFRSITVTSDPARVLPYDDPIGIALDTRPGKDILYVLFEGTARTGDINIIAIIDDLSGKGSGNIAPRPTRLISGLGLNTDRTRLSRPVGLWLDPDHDRLYVADRGSALDNGADDAILVFDQASTIDGNVSPAWIIKGAAQTLFNQPYMLSMVSYTVGTETKHRLFVATTGDADETGRILVFDDIDAALDPLKCPMEASGSMPLPVCSPVPNLVLTGPKTQLYVPRGVAVDPQAGGDHIFVSNGAPSSTHSINIFENVAIPQGSQTVLDQKPSSMISPSIHGPTGVTVNTQTETLYLSSIIGDSIAVIPDINNINTVGSLSFPKIRRIFGKNTILSAPAGLALIPAAPSDSHGDRLYVANLFANNVLEFDLADLDDPNKCATPPECNITPTAISEDSDPANPLLMSPLGIVADPTRKLIYVSNRDLSSFDDRLGDSIVVYQRTDSGLDPIRKIQGYNTGLVGPAGLYLDLQTDLLYVANRSVHQVLVFDVSDQAFQSACDTSPVQVCNLAPMRKITRAPNASNSLLLNAPNWVFMDDLSNPPKLYVSNRDNSTILVYNQAETIDGGALPDRSIRGATPGINVPVGIFLDPRK